MDGPYRYFGCMVPADSRPSVHELNEVDAEKKKKKRCQPFPADHHVAGRLHDLDHAVVDAAAGLNDEMFLKAIRETRATVLRIRADFLAARHHQGTGRP